MKKTSFTYGSDVFDKSNSSWSKTTPMFLAELTGINLFNLKRTYFMKKSMGNRGY